MSQLYCFCGCCFILRLFVCLEQKKSKRQKLNIKSQQLNWILLLDTFLERLQEMLLCFSSFSSSNNDQYNQWSSLVLGTINRSQHIKFYLIFNIQCQNHYFSVWGIHWKYTNIAFIGLETNLWLLVFRIKFKSRI